MTLLQLAWKNMLRYGRRSAITAAAIAIGLTAYLAMDSMLLGLEMESERNLIWYETGSAKILHSDYWEEHDELPLDVPIDNPEPMIDRLEGAGIPATPRIAFNAELVVMRDPYPEDGSMMVRAYGVDPERDGLVFRENRHVAEGRWLEAGRSEVVVGSILAERLNARVGFPMIMITRTRDGYFQTIDAEVVGIVDTPNPVVNRASVYLPIDVVSELLQMDGAATEIALHLPETARSKNALAPVREIIEASPNAVVLPWQTLAADYIALTEAKSSASGIMLFLVFVIAAVGISNTMIMAVFERTREIGTLRALGMSDRRVRVLFLYEAGAVGLVGSVAGLLLGAAATFALVHWGIDYSAIVQDMDIGYRSAGIMRGAWNPRAFVSALGVGIVLSIVSAYLPTQHAVTRSVPDCLRYQR